MHRSQISIFWFSLVGNFICDIMRTATQSDIALLNSGSLRSDMVHPTGPFKMKVTHHLRLHSATFVDYRFWWRLSFHIYSDTHRRPHDVRRGKIFKIDTSNLLHMAFLGFIKALVMWFSLKRLRFSAIFRDFLNL